MIKEPLDQFAENADVLLADSGLLCADWKEAAPHLSPKGCAELAAGANAKKLLLTHLNPRYTKEQHEAEAHTIRPDVEYVSIGECYTI
jgi:ribonuclease BN (tRNA processing enzyme)